MNYLKSTLLPIAIIAALAAMFLWSGPAAASRGLCAPASQAPISLGCSSWRVVKSPNVGSGDYLQNVAAVSASDVWAVGSHFTGSGFQTLIEQWLGKQWSILMSPNPGSEQNLLYGVAAVSASDIWAVGDSSNGGYLASQTLIEHWDGTSWSVVNSPNVGPSDGLSGLTVVSASDIWAVGTYANSTGPIQTLIEHWDGTSWSVVASPNVESFDTYLNEVAAISASDIWAVGHYTVTNHIDFNLDQKLTEHWDGTGWSVVKSPNVGQLNNPVNNYLNGVAIVSAHDIWAVGFAGVQTLIEHWNGSKWSIFPSPNSDSNGQLQAVTMVSANDIWTVGFYINNMGDAQTLIEHWDGTRWNVVHSPNVRRKDFLEGVAAVSMSDIWAVGGHLNNHGNKEWTLIEHCC